MISIQRTLIKIVDIFHLLNMRFYSTSFTSFMVFIYNLVWSLLKWFVTFINDVLFLIFKVVNMLL